MTQSDTERIEKESQKYAREYTGYIPIEDCKEIMEHYISGATAEHDKARNQAIDDVLGIFENKDVVSIRFLIKEIKLLRTKQETSD